MMKFVAEHLQKMHDHLNTGYRLSGRVTGDPRTGVAFADSLIGGGIDKTPAFEAARAKLKSAVDSATAISGPAIYRGDDGRRAEYRRALEALHAYSLVLDGAKPSALAADSEDTSSVLNPVPPAPPPT